MTAVQFHIIRKQRVIAHYRGEQTDAFDLQRQLANLLSGVQANQALDTVLSEFSAGDEWVVLDKIEIEVGTMAGDRWESDFLQQIQAALRNKLFDAIPDALLQGETIRKTNEQVDFEQLIYFLKQGFFEHIPFRIAQPENTSAFRPWMTDLIGKLSEAQLQVLNALLIQHTTARQRFLQQASPDSWLLFLRKKTGHKPATDALLALVYPHLLAADAGQRDQIYKRILVAIDAGKPIDVVHLVGDKYLKPASDDTDLSGLNEPPTQAFFVQNAGVVLLHPFVFTCFDALGWLHKGRFTNETTRQKAVLMWHYLATGTNMADEYELTLAKLLSGLPLKTPFLDELLPLSDGKKKKGKRCFKPS